MRMGDLGISKGFMTLRLDDSSELSSGNRIPQRTGLQRPPHFGHRHVALR